RVCAGLHGSMNRMLWVSLMRRVLLSILFVLLSTGPALAAGDGDHQETHEQPSQDPLTERLRAEVQRYYLQTGVQVTEEDEQAGVEAARFMVLDGVSIEQLTAAVDQAILSHRPDQAIRFEIAVPIRVASQGTANEPRTSADPPGEPTQAPASEGDRAALAAETKAQQRMRRSHRIRGNLALGFGIAMIPLGSVGVGTGLGLLAFVNAVEDVTRETDGFGALFYGLWVGLFGPAAYLAAIPAIIIGTSFIATGGVLIGVGVRHLQAARRADVLNNPDRRYSIARRAHVDWGFRLQL
ncbi:MAG: hypothetical protein CL928_18195, partial [Deltaproteobacteria bacterium]|nr:hypothetical protein [Deltaproteobacteria bacterium]